MVLGMDTEFTIDGGVNDGMVHLRISSITGFGRQVVKLVAKYWREAQKVRIHL